MRDEKLRTYLLHHSQQTITTIAVRAALRSFITSLKGLSNHPEQTPPSLVLTTGRALIIATVNARFGSSGVQETNSREMAKRLTDKVLDELEIPRFGAAHYGLVAAGFAASVNEKSEILNIYEASTAGTRNLRKIHSTNSNAKFSHFFNPEIKKAYLAVTLSSECYGSGVLDATLVDARQAQENKNTDLLSLPLWPSYETNAEMPDVSNAEALVHKVEVLEQYSKHGSPWSFWRNWYEGFLNGKPLDWELQKRVALIPNEVWEAGVEAVAEEIEGIQKPFEIREKIKELKSQLVEIEEPIAGIGHNNPPEEIDTAPPDRTVTIVWAELSALEKATKEEAPDQEQLKKIGIRLKAISNRIGSFIKDSAYDSAKAGLTGYAGGVASTNWPWVKAQLLLISSTIDEWLAYLILAL